MTGGEARRQRTPAAIVARRIVLAAAVSLTATLCAAQGRVYVEATDRRTGAPLTDLQPSEVVVHENGLPRPVSDVRLANRPVKLLLLVDNGEGTTRALDRVRDGVRQLVERLPAHQELSLLTLSPEPRWVVQGTLDPAALQDGLDRVTGSGAASVRLLDGLVEATAWAASDAIQLRPVVVVVTGDGAEGSGSRAARFETVLANVERAGASLHAVLLKTPRPASLVRRMSVPEAIVRDLTAWTGGVFESPYLGSRLDQPFGKIADAIRTRTRELSRQHLIRYERPAGSPPRRVQVSVTRLGAHALVTMDGRPQ